jgi:hypothetical protein
MSGGSDKTEAINKIDPTQMAMYNQNYQRASAIANLPFQPYPGERAVGVTPLQQYGRQSVLDYASNTAAADTLDSAATGMKGMMGYTPTPIPGAGGIMARQVTAPTVSAGMLKDTDLSPYMNPYTQNVIDTSLADLSRARDTQRVADNQAATRARAFGGSRQGVADSLTNDAYLRNVASATANLRSAGYANAQSAASADIGRRYDADTFNATNQFNADQFNANAGLLADQFNTNTALDVAKNNATNDLNAAKLRLDAGRSMAEIGGMQDALGFRRASTVSALGDQDRQIAQAREDAMYEEFMRMIGYPAQTQGVLNSALSGMPSNSTTTQTTRDTPGFKEYGEFGLKLGELANQGKWFGK